MNQIIYGVMEIAYTAAYPFACVIDSCINSENNAHSHYALRNVLARTIATTVPILIVGTAATYGIYKFTGN